MKRVTVTQEYTGYIDVPDDWPVDLDQIKFRMDHGYEEITWENVDWKNCVEQVILVEEIEEAEGK